MKKWSAPLAVGCALLAIAAIVGYLRLQGQMHLAASIDYQTNTTRRLLNEARKNDSEKRVAAARYRLTFLMHWYEHYRPKLTVGALAQMVDENYEHTTSEITMELRKIAAVDLGPSLKDWVQPLPE